MTEEPLESYGVFQEFIGGMHPINFLVRKISGLYGQVILSWCRGLVGEEWTHHQLVFKQWRQNVMKTDLDICENKCACTDGCTHGIKIQCEDPFRDENLVSGKSQAN